MNRLSLYFKNAPQGLTRMKFYRIDDNKNWDSGRYQLIPVENRIVYVHDDFWFSLFVPEDSALLVTFDYDVESR